METQARYVVIGAFSVAALLALLGFLLWLAKVQIDRSYSQYDILFDSVAGLSQASAVNYNGVDVGKVMTIALDKDDPSLVRVRIEVNATTPVRADTVATLSAQGVTGVSIVALEGGDANAEPLLRLPSSAVAVIKSKPSVVQELMEGVPELLEQANTLITALSSLITPENRKQVADILANVNAATTRLDVLATRTDTALRAVDETLAQADKALLEAKDAFANANKVIQNDVPGIMDQLGMAADGIANTASGLQDFSQTGLLQFTALATDARGLVASLGALTNRISADPGRFLLGDQTPDYRR